MRPPTFGIAVTVLIAVALLLWSKWVPYATRLADIAVSGAYVNAVWKALVRRC